MLTHVKNEQKTAMEKFLDSRSHVSQDGHEYLFGRDKSLRRAAVCIEDQGRCYYCAKFVGPEFGELHHVVGGYGPARCDCIQHGKKRQLVWTCATHHRQKHPQVGG